jgi:hypothetical protein
MFVVLLSVVFLLLLGLGDVILFVVNPFLAIIFTVGVVLYWLAPPFRGTSLPWHRRG